MIKEEKQSIALKAFKEAFIGFNEPFAQADEVIKKMESGERQEYILSCDAFRKSKALDIELKSLTQHFMNTLAFELCDPIDIAAYRATLIFIQKFTERLDWLSQVHTELIKKNQKRKEEVI